MVDLLTRVIYVFANIDVILLKVVAFGNNIFIDYQ